MLNEPINRYELLKTLLLWEGRLSNARLRELLDMKVARASQLIREFREEHPSWVEWDTVARSFHATPAAYRYKTDTAASLAHYLSLVGIPHVTSMASSGQTLWSAFPDLAVPSPRTFAQMSQAIRSSRRVLMTYRSMGTPKPHSREISPHSLVRAGRRWHVRAFCTTKQEFRDYALGRIEDSKVLSEARERTVADDEAWNTMLSVRLIAHPALSSEQQDVVRLEYFANTSARVESCRAALVSYFIQDVRAATDIARQTPPDFQLAVENMEELRKWMFLD